MSRSLLLLMIGTSGLCERPHTNDDSPIANRASQHTALPGSTTIEMILGWDRRYAAVTDCRDHSVPTKFVDRESFGSSFADRHTGGLQENATRIELLYAYLAHCLAICGLRLTSCRIFRGNRRHADPSGFITPFGPPALPKIELPWA